MKYVITLDKNSQMYSYLKISLLFIKKKRHDLKHKTQEVTDIPAKNA